LFLCFCESWPQALGGGDAWLGGFLHAALHEPVVAAAVRAASALARSGQLGAGELKLTRSELKITPVTYLDKPSGQVLALRTAEEVGAQLRRAAR